MKTAAVDKSAGCGDTPAPWPGNSLPHSSAKTPFILRPRKKRAELMGEMEWEKVHRKMGR